MMITISNSDEYRIGYAAVPQELPAGLACEIPTMVVYFDGRIFHLLEPTGFFRDGPKESPAIDIETGEIVGIKWEIECGRPDQCQR